MLKNKQFKISHQLLAGFGFLLLLLFATTLLGVQQINRVETALTTVSNVNNAKSKEAINYRGSVHDRAILVRDVVLADTTQQAKNYADQIRSLADDYARADRQMDDLFARHRATSKQEADAIARIKSLDADISPKIAQVIEQRLADNTTQATELLKAELADDFTEWLGAINAFLAIQEAESQALTTEANSLIAGYTKAVGGLALFGLIVGSLLAVGIARRIRGQLGAEPYEVQAIANAIAQGDLSIHVPVTSKNENSLLGAMAAMKQSLAQLIGQIEQSAQQVNQASSHVAQSNLNISARTEEQASSIEETSATMEQMTSTVKQNADNATQANVLAASASDVAQRGGSAVHQVVTTMREINDSSRKIVDIIDVIDSIAFQTNILALNAAVEAARAGDLGRGFAVVASEVRSLAQRSASAAKEIKQLIDDSVSRTAHGTERAEQAGQTMQDVVKSVQQVTEIIAEITSASHEQAQGIEQINLAVGQVDRITRDNAAMVQDSAQASNQLTGLARELSSIVKQFRLA